MKLIKTVFANLLAFAIFSLLMPVLIAELIAYGEIDF
jgi:hypothetical protein